MAQVETYRVCSRCLGTGIDDNLKPPGPCIPCNATGKVINGWIDISDIMDKLNDIKEKVDEIKAVVDEL